MKKNTTVGRKQQRNGQSQQRLTIGLDLGDRYSRYCILDERGEIVGQDRLATSKKELEMLFGRMAPSRVALEVGTHSPWVSRHLAAMGHEVIVANPRNVAWITKSRNKNDRIDAEKLARMARVDVRLLAPIRHRGEQAQRDLAVLRGRAILVEARTKLINAARGLVKSQGERLPGCESERVGEALGALLSEATGSMVLPLLRSVAGLNQEIRAYEKQIQEIAKRYGDIELLTAVDGVGILTALMFVLTLEDPTRFARSREVGAYLGLKPRREQSGDRDRQLGISKQGDRHLRWMLLQCAHCILRRDSVDSDLRRWGLRKLEQQATGRGKQKGRNKRGKKRVLVAVARRLAVLLHHLWVNGEVYDPLFEAKQHRGQAAAA